MKFLFSLRFAGDRRRERRATRWRMNFVVVVIQTGKRAVFAVYGRSLFARDGILCEEEHLLTTGHRNCARTARKAEVLLFIHILVRPSQQLG